jgi:hypothetical protein
VVGSSTDARYADTGHLCYGDVGTLIMAMPFDVNSSLVPALASDGGAADWGGIVVPIAGERGRKSTTAGSRRRSTTAA